jgi:WD40 repeat protein
MYAPTSTILWDVASGKTITPHAAPWPQQADLIFSNDGRYIATTTNKHSTAVDLWNGGSLAHILTEPFPGGGQELPEAFSQDDAQLVTIGLTKSGADSGTLYLWHLH